jgi:integrase
MVQDLHNKIGKDRGKNAANQAIRLLRRLMNFSLSRFNTPVNNPCKGVEWFKDGRRNVVIKPVDMPRWFKAVNALENETSRDYFLLVLFSGLRRNEAMTLTWDNVDLHEKTLTIPTTKNGEPHTLPLSTFLLNLLQERFNRWHQPTGYVFPSWSKTGHMTNVQHDIKKLQASGLPYTLHDLRRSFLTTAEQLDISSWTVKRLANHRQTDVTGQHYIVHSIDRLREPMEKISEELLRLAKETRN